LALDLAQSMQKKAGESTYLLLQKTDKPWNYPSGGKPSRETKLLKSFPFVNLLHLKPSPSL
jgi:hypothetical protein